MNTLVPEQRIPSHQGPDAQSVDPDFDVVTMAVKVPETLAHLHYWNVELSRAADQEEVLAAFHSSTRIAMVRLDDGLTGINSVKELMADLKRPNDNLYEVALWEDLVTIQNNELFYAYMVDNQAIVIPETIDAIRALTGLSTDSQKYIAKTNAAEACALQDRYVAAPNRLAVSLGFGARIDGDRSGRRERDALLFGMRKSRTPHEFGQPAVLVGSGVGIAIGQADQVESKLHRY